MIFNMKIMSCHAIQIFNSFFLPLMLMLIALFLFFFFAVFVSLVKIYIYKRCGFSPKDDSIDVPSQYVEGDKSPACIRSLYKLQKHELHSYLSISATEFRCS